MAYSDVQFFRLDKNEDGTATMVFRHTGNAGEPPVLQAVPVNTAVMPSADWSRAQAMARQAILNINLSFYAGAIAAVGSMLDTTTPLPTPPVSTYGAFMAASAPFTPGATPQDVFTITGSATRTALVYRTGLTSVQTTAAMNAWALVKRSTANTSGTSSLVPGVPERDSYPAATALVRAYTVNPTLGTVVGSVWTGRIASPAPATAPGDVGCEVLDETHPITLVGTSQVLAWNLGGIALPAGLSVQAWVWWTEN